MFGVDEFRDIRHAEECKAKAEKRLEKSKQLVMPALGLTVIAIILAALADLTDHMVMKALYVVWVFVIFAFISYSGWWFYIGKLFSLPFRKLSCFGILGRVIAVIPFCFVFFYGMCALLFAPIAFLPYVKYLSNITINRADGFI